MSDIRTEVRDFTVIQPDAVFSGPYGSIPIKEEANYEIDSTTPALSVALEHFDRFYINAGTDDRPTHYRYADKGFYIVRSIVQSMYVKLPDGNLRPTIEAISIITPQPKSRHQNWVLGEFHHTMSGREGTPRPLRDEHIQTFLALGHISI